MPVWDLISNSPPPLFMWLIHIIVVGCHPVVNPVWFKAGQEQLTLPYFLTILENLSVYLKEIVSFCLHIRMCTCTVQCPEALEPHFFLLTGCSW